MPHSAMKKADNAALGGGALGALGGAALGGAISGVRARSGAIWAPRSWPWVKPPPISFASPGA